MDTLLFQFTGLLYQLLSSRFCLFVFNHSGMIGFVVGLISLLRFEIKHIPHLVILGIFTIGIVYYLIGKNPESFISLFYKQESYIFIKMLGNYLIGFFYGIALINLIQIITGANHD